MKILFCLQVFVIGFGTVLLTLTAICFVIKLMSLIIRKLERRQ